jgi:hypothetical protein
MWSQYGDDSKGFCIVFDKERLNFKINGLAEKTDYLISGRVEYYEWLHLIGGGATIEYGQNINLSDSDVFEIINYNRMLHSIYLKKSIDWRDECEFRWLLFSNESNPLFVSIVDTVEAVVLGCGFPIDKYEKAREYCDSLNCPCYILQYQHPQYQLLKI